MMLIDRVQEQIREMILSKEYDAAGFILNEGALSERFGVSRSTVREAVRSLETRGYVKRIHGKGVQVVDGSKMVFTQSLTDLIEREDGTYADLLEVRSALEVFACALAVERVTEEELEALERLVADMEGRESCTDDYYKSDFAFHLGLIRSAKNPIITAMVNGYTGLLYKQILLTRAASCCEREHHFHRNILEAVKARDAELARYAMCAHLASTRRILTESGQIPASPTR
ncbi:FadR/GntR family transcriptional regulator [Oscillibacter sp.]|uniref:FadR/GntR family transcriptional regulator n=1 Tax=Oscillibacter sp. TaxID=1945593 RepID=UPI00262AEFA1|nr:FadR/GntR family transcriptional regulator [Oscillibacter sp.]MDD3347568.1 FadR/GntR family transcriptional regulator [Oscillibacter sp.]